MLYGADGQPIAKSVDAYKLPKGSFIDPAVSKSIQWRIKNDTKFREGLEKMARMTGKPSMHLAMSKHHNLSQAMLASQQALYDNQQMAKQVNG